MNIFIVNIEPLETRYTSQWTRYLSGILIKGVKGKKIVHNINGKLSSTKPTEGAFLDFAATNFYKGDQVKRISERFQLGGIQDGDHIIFLDAWHPGIINVKYMKDLLGVDVKLHGLWHAGSYDSQDFLGRLIKDKQWSYAFEKAVFHSLDYNWYATDAHRGLFMGEIFKWFNTDVSEKCMRTGWPMEYMAEELAPFKTDKRDLILFPHRLAPEKQPEIFRDLALAMPEYEFVVCQDNELTKDEYHKLLGEAKMVFSANLQETLGISAFEGALLGAVPLVPNRLSYIEMYDDTWKYPSEWTSDFSAYEQNKDKLISRIRETMKNYITYEVALSNLVETLQDKYFSCTNLIQAINDA